MTYMTNFVSPHVDLIKSTALSKATREVILPYEKQYKIFLLISVRVFFCSQHFSPVCTSNKYYVTCSYYKS